MKPFNLATVCMHAAKVNSSKGSRDLWEKGKQLLKSTKKNRNHNIFVLSMLVVQFSLFFWKELCLCLVSINIYITYHKTRELFCGFEVRNINHHFRQPMSTATWSQKCISLHAKLHRLTESSALKSRSLFQLQDTCLVKVQCQFEIKLPSPLKSEECPRYGIFCEVSMLCLASSKAQGNSRMLS